MEGEKFLSNKSKIQYLLTRISSCNSIINKYHDELLYTPLENMDTIFKLINKLEEENEINHKKINRMRRKDNIEYDIHDLNEFKHIFKSSKKLTDNKTQYYRDWRETHKDYYKNYYNRALKGNMFHCNICDKNITQKYITQHLSKKIHLIALEKAKNSNPQIEPTILPIAIKLQKANIQETNKQETRFSYSFCF